MATVTHTHTHTSYPKASARPPKRRPTHTFFRGEFERTLGAALVAGSKPQGSHQGQNAHSRGAKHKNKREHKSISRSSAAQQPTPSPTVCPTRKTIIIKNTNTKMGVQRCATTTTNHQVPTLDKRSRPPPGMDAQVSPTKLTDLTTVGTSDVAYRSSNTLAPPSQTSHSLDGALIRVRLRVRVQDFPPLL